MRLRFLVFAVAFSLVALAVDVYVLRRWRRFARPRRALGWTVAPLTVLAALMPFVFPAYALTSRWWDGGAARALVISLWAFHYVPRVLIGAWLVVVDALRGLGWIGRRLAPGGAPGAAPSLDAPVPGTAAPAGTDGVPTRPLTRREALRTVGWSAAALPFVAVGTGLAKTVHDFEVRRVRVPLAGLPRALAGLRIAQLSDLHAGSFTSSAPSDEAARLLLAERPDLVVVTGDFVNRDAAELPRVLPALGRLRADLGVFGVLGNHDHYAHVPEVLAALAATPVRMLVNARHTLALGGGALHLLGLDNTGFGQRHADLPRTLAGLDAPGEREELRVVLAHDPSFWDEARAASGAALTLSGHTHGGQIGWEWAQRGVNLADLRYDRTAGLYAEPGRLGPQRLYVNRGLGTTGPPLRLGVRPEITVLELVPA